jgi:hypothetical protein
MAHACNLSNQEAETRGLRVQGQPGYTMSYCLKKIKNIYWRLKAECMKQNISNTIFFL